MKKMKLVIAGSRYYTDATELAHILDPWSKMNADELVVISLVEKGASKLGEEWARTLGFAVEKWGADRVTLGKRAGYVRNCQLVLEGDVNAMLVVRDQRASKEHDHLIAMAAKIGADGIKTHVHKTVTNTQQPDPNQRDMLTEAPEFNEPDDYIRAGLVNA